jgi:hypothetical protein
MQVLKTSKLFIRSGYSYRLKSDECLQSIPSIIAAEPMASTMEDHNPLMAGGTAPTIGQQSHKYGSTFRNPFSSIAELQNFTALLHNVFRLSILQSNRALLKKTETMDILRSIYQINTDNLEKKIDWVFGDSQVHSIERMSKWIPYLFIYLFIWLTVF